MASKKRDQANSGKGYKTTQISYDDFSRSYGAYQAFAETIIEDWFYDAHFVQFYSVQKNPSQKYRSGSPYWNVGVKVTQVDGKSFTNPKLLTELTRAEMIEVLYMFQEESLRNRVFYENTYDVTKSMPKDLQQAFLKLQPAKKRADLAYQHKDTTFHDFPSILTTRQIMTSLFEDNKDDDEEHVEEQDKPLHGEYSNSADEDDDEDNNENGDGFETIGEAHEFSDEQVAQLFSGLSFKNKKCMEKTLLNISKPSQFIAMSAPYSYRTSFENDKLLNKVPQDKLKRAQITYSVYSVENAESELITGDLSFAETCRTLENLEKAFIQPEIKKDKRHAFVENYQSQHFSQYRHLASVIDKTIKLFPLS